MGDLQLDIFNRSWYAKNSEIGMYTMYTLSGQTLFLFPLLFLDMTDPQKTSSSKKHLTSLIMQVFVCSMVPERRRTVTSINKLIIRWGGDGGRE